MNAPILSTVPDPTSAIQLPCHGTDQFLTMDGITVARTAYKAMVNAVRLAMALEKTELSEISAFIPHPGSQRILQNVAEHLELPLPLVRSTLVDTGNTSSSSIPLTLNRYWSDLPAHGRIAMTAFGSGFTAASAIAQFIGD
jgi:3-oxoacyl-[acyl-carrier-protein] synthase III